MSETQTKAHEADDGQVPLNFTEEAQEVEIETAEAEPESQEQNLGRLKDNEKKLFVTLKTYSPKQKTFAKGYKI